MDPKEPKNSSNQEAIEGLEPAKQEPVYSNRSDFKERQREYAKAAYARAKAQAKERRDAYKNSPAAKARKEQLKAKAKERRRADRDRASVEKRPPAAADSPPHASTEEKLALLDLLRPAAESSATPDPQLETAQLETGAKQTLRKLRLIVGGRSEKKEEEERDQEDR